MNLYAACRLAEDLFDRGIAVHTIGHFLPPDEVTPVTPWAVAITCPLTGRRTVVRSAEEAERIASPSSAAAAARSVARSPTREPETTPEPVAPDGLLF